MAQATEPAAVFTLDQAIQAAGGTAPATEAAASAVEAARAGRTVANLRPNPIVQGQVENVIGTGPYGLGITYAKTMFNASEGAH